MLKNNIKATKSTPNQVFLLSFIIVINFLFSQVQNILLGLLETFLLHILNNIYLTGMPFPLRFRKALVNVHFIYLHG